MGNEESSVVSGASQVKDSISTDGILVCYLEVAYTISLINEIVKVGINLANHGNFFNLEIKKVIWICLVFASGCPIIFSLDFSLFCYCCNTAFF